MAGTQRTDRPKITFFGSGPVAAASLKLLADDFDIEAVITKPRPPHHRGDVPVVDLANELGLPLLEAKDKDELDKLFTSNPVTNKLAILIDFGIIVSRKVIDYFELGIINSHFSILPALRGADPISFAILSGQKQTGVSLMLLVEAMDEGPLLAYGEYNLPADITTPQLTEHLINFSHRLLIEVAPKYLAGTVKPHDQSITGRKSSYSRKLTKQDSILDWQKPVAELEREVRAYAGWPRSRCTIGTTEVVVTSAHILNGDGAPGTLWLESKQIGMHGADGILVFDTLIPAGKKEMSAAAFMAGYKPV